MLTVDGGHAWNELRISSSNPVNQRMRINVGPHADLSAAPQSLYRGERRIDIIAIIDQWYGPDYRYVKVRGQDNSIYILRCDEICDRWELIMFSARATQR